MLIMTTIMRHKQNNCGVWYCMCVASGMAGNGQLNSSDDHGLTRGLRQRNIALQL
jgi:hypothetical protein